MKKMLLTGFASLYTILSFAQATDNPLRTPRDMMVDSLVRSSFAMDQCVGLVVGIIRNGNISIYNYGETVRGNGKLPDENTVFEIGSISKTFTGTLLALQVNRGKVKLDDPIGKFLPDSVPTPVFDGTPVTMVSLSNHSSGFPRLAPNMFQGALDMKNPYAQYSNEKLFRFVKNFKPQRRVGDKYEYSNVAAGLLGALLARNANTNYATLLEREITLPLQMKDTKIKLTESMQSRFAQGYTKELDPQGPWDFQEIAGAGGIRSTMHDMLIYARANMSKQPTTLEKAIALTHIQTFSGESSVGLGWHLANRDGRHWVVHNGQTGGYHSFIGVDEETGVAVVVLSNVSEDNRVGARLLGRM
ncbi:serine hydrolase [Chitinophaga sp. SYP-B3965]|uniref:serine hydrolase domain-containing protein n=1 Tax=Chitinophaga sp. SYP-B3965 TaxID=2663120 RepID=UPI001299F532|nr:serine hydrolase [Chitinophaga sp. SYP-B3965]MRG44535.1 serine hydrolase [Chitinophaga sp. SYP-B3965]